MRQRISDGKRGGEEREGGEEKKRKGRGERIRSKRKSKSRGFMVAKREVSDRSE